MVETRPRLVDTIGVELKNAINEEVFKIQAEAHQKLQTAMRDAIQKMGFEFNYRETHKLEQEVLCEIKFSIPRI
jgi:hypothetical protein